MASGVTPGYELKGGQLLVIGEAPGVDDVDAGRPFTGEDGDLLWRALKKFGVSRDECDIINVCHSRPPKSDIRPWLQKGDERVLRGRDFLHEHLKTHRYRAILILGNAGLWATTGNKSGISGWRGTQATLYAMPANDLTVFAMSPAAVRKSPTSVPLFAFDIKRFADVARNGPLAQRKRKLVLPEDDGFQAAYEYLVANPRAWVSVDIENDKTQLACCGFGLTPDWAVVIKGENIEWIRALLELPNPKVFHNAPYDVPYLEHRCGVKVNGFIHDTLFMHQAYRPELARDLGTLTSLYTTLPYYKSMHADWKDTQDDKTLWTYNALDCVATIEIAEVLRKRLVDENLWQVYQMTIRMLPIANAMSMRGVKYDAERAEQLRHRVRRNADRWQRILNKLAGREINTNSPKQVIALLYNDLRLPGKRSTEAKTVAAHIAATSNKDVKRILRVLLKLKALKKFESSYLNAKVSRDGRMRTSLNPAGTETGRWSASKFLITEGANLQTPPKPWKPCFVADDGMYLGIADYSQIEARFVAYDSEDLEMIGVFERGEDIHRAGAARIFNIPYAEVTDHMRDRAKTMIHALDYDVGIDELVRTLNKKAHETGVWVTRSEVKFVRERFREKYERVVRWQNRQWETVKRTGKLTTPFGRMRTFTGPKTGEGALHTRKEAIASVPQGTVPDMLNVAIERLEHEPPCENFSLLLQIHDAIMFQGPKESLDVWAPAVIQAMDVPVSFHGRVCRVPVELKYGTRWSEVKKYGQQKG